MRQMAGGSNMIAFRPKGGKAGAFRVLNALNIIDISNNLGDAKSLVTHPATTTHQRLTADERAQLGIGDDLLRLSVGLEDARDLIADLSQARSEERRVGKECVRTCGSRWSPYHEQKNKNNMRKQ